MTLMFVVARDAVDLWDQLSHEFAGRGVRIVLDRRRGDEAPGNGHGRPERRRRPDVDAELRRRGFATVSLDELPYRRLTAGARAPRADSHAALGAPPGIRSR
jgi:hypothetical protein